MGLFSRLFKKERQMTEVKERDPLTIQVGDIVTYNLEDYQVVGKLIYYDSGYRWYAYQLENNGKSLWLSAEMDDELELGIYEKINIPLHEPIPEKMEHEGVTYYRDESGTAQVQGEGRGKNISGRSCRYFDFCDEEEERFLSVEIWGTEIEVSKGIAIEDYEINILAGS